MFGQKILIDQLNYPCIPNSLYHCKINLILKFIFQVLSYSNSQVVTIHLNWPHKKLSFLNQNLNSLNYSHSCKYEKKRYDSNSVRSSSLSELMTHEVLSKFDFADYEVKCIILQLQETECISRESLTQIWTFSF